MSLSRRKTLESCSSSTNAKQLNKNIQETNAVANYTFTKQQNNNNYNCITSTSTAIKSKRKINNSNNNNRHKKNNNNNKQLLVSDVEQKLTDYAQPYATPTKYMHTHTLSTFKTKSTAAYCTTSSSHAKHAPYYFSSLDNRSQRHQYQHNQHYQQQVAAEYRCQLQQQSYLTPYSVANLPILQQTSSGSFSSENSSNSETATNNITNQEQQEKPEFSKYNQCHHYISQNQSKSTHQQQKILLETASLKHNKRNKLLQHRQLPNPMPECST